MHSPRPTIAIACGGTGGHFLPGLSIARELKRRGIKPILFIGGHHPAEQLLVAQEIGIAAVPSPTVRLPSNKLKLPLALIKLASCIQANKRLLREHKVEAALGMGSFASVPMAMAANSLRLPLFLHEGNAVMGRANARLCRYAKGVFLSLPLRRPVKTTCPTQLVGMPIRGQLLRDAQQPPGPDELAALRTKLGLRPDLPTLLIFGGSQGASFLNNLIIDLLPLLVDVRSKLQVIHLTGSHHNDDYDLLYKSMGIKALVKKSEREMQRMYHAADLVLCRAGASTIFELAVFGKPAILVPLPTALDDHQKANANTLLDAEAAILLEEHLIKPKHLADMLRSWTQNPRLYKAQAASVRDFARPHAVRDIVDGILALSGLADRAIPADQALEGDTECFDPNATHA